MINEMVVDGGGHFSSAVIDGVHTLDLLFSSLAAHGRAEGNTGEHNITQRTTESGYSTRLRQGSMNSVPL